MPLLDGCCCYANLRDGSRASGVFGIVTSVANLIINIYLLVTLTQLEDYLLQNERVVWLPPGILVFLYIELIFNLALGAISFLLLVGVERGYPGRKLCKPFLVGSCCFRGYEILMGIFVVAWLGGSRIGDVLFMYPAVTLIVAYWVVNTLILIAAVMCVVSYLQETIDHVFHKQKRFQRYARRYNVMFAAGKVNTAMNSAAGSMNASMHSLGVASSMGQLPGQKW